MAKENIMEYAGLQFSALQILSIQPDGTVFNISFFSYVLLVLCARSIFMQDFINIFNQVLYLIKNNYL